MSIFFQQSEKKRLMSSKNIETLRIIGSPFHIICLIYEHVSLPVKDLVLQKRKKSAEMFFGGYISRKKKQKN